MKRFVLKFDMGPVKAGEVVTLGAPIADGGRWFDDNEVPRVHHIVDLIPVLHESYMDPIAYLSDHNLGDTLEAMVA